MTIHPSNTLPMFKQWPVLVGLAGGKRRGIVRTLVPHDIVLVKQ
jgi:hypothetical protein